MSYAGRSNIKTIELSIPILILIAVGSAGTALAVNHFIVQKKKKSKSTRSNDIITNNEQNGVDDEILNLWFDGPLDQNYRTKWFTTPGSTERNAIDTMIDKEYGDLLHDAENGKLSHWQNNHKSCMALIILLDQFSRHVYRKPEERPMIDSNNELTLKISQMMLTKEWDKHLDLLQFVFMLMPFRHTATIENLELVLDCIKKREIYEKKLCDLLQKFKNTTIKKLQELQGIKPDNDEILEHFFFKADETDLPKDILVKSMKTFLNKYLMSSGKAKKSKYDSIAISLSGGVDSMVIAKILCYFREQYGYKIYAIHIDYGNRSESCKEANFVESWCEDHGILFRRRTVTEVTRGITARDDYEKKSREIRFNFYQEVLAETGAPAVIFGHHLGDVQENVISNAMKGSSPLELSGMTMDSIVAGVWIWRPLLEFTKDPVYKFSHKYGVPYFKDTTPTWSTRGKLRNDLLPMLANVYGDGFGRNLAVLATESDHLKELVYHSIFQPFWDTVVRDEMGSYFDTKSYSDQPLLFWKIAIREVLHSMGLGMIGDRGVREFLERIQVFKKIKSNVLAEQVLDKTKMSKKEYVLSQHLKTNPNKKGKITGSWLELKRDYHTFLSSDGVFFIFRAESSLPHKSKKTYNHNFDGQSIPIPLNDYIFPKETFGVWEITVSKEDIPSKHITENYTFNGEPVICQAPVFSTLQEFFTGKFFYHLCVRKECTKLVIQNSKAKKNVSWGRVENNLKASIPIFVPEDPLENLSQSNDEKKDIDSFHLIKVSYNFRG